MFYIRQQLYCLHCYHQLYIQETTTKYDIEDGRNLKKNNSSIINLINWEPGQSDTKRIDIVNTGSLATDVLMNFNNITGDLEDALWSKISVYVNNADKSGKAEFNVYDKTKDKASKWKRFEISKLDGILATAYENNTNLVFSIEDYDSLVNADGSIKLLPGESISVILTYGMYEEAGNEYQDKSFSMDLSIEAKQSVEEKDGFGDNTYDEEAEYAGKKL